MYCRNCGSALDDSQKYCSYCGSRILLEPGDKPVAAEEPVKAGLNIGMLIWSIIGLVVCCSPFSIPALIMTILAINMPVVEAEKKIKLAKTFNIISIVWGVLYFMLEFIVGFIFILGLAEALAFMP